MSFLSRLFPSSSPIPPLPAPDQKDDPGSCPQDPPPPRMRLTLTPYPHVYGYPPSSSGGVLLLPDRALAPIDLEFLGLPAIPADEVAPPEAGEEEEEAFCERMRLLGAEWWLGGEEERERAGEERRRRRPGCSAWRDKSVVVVGFEGSGVDAGRGVWVYRVSQVRERQVPGDGARAREKMWEQARRIVRVGAARTMEERCRVIQECGGEYFESVEAWRKVALEEHVREGILTK